jgi:hypothetical protein
MTFCVLLMVGEKASCMCIQLDLVSSVDSLARQGQEATIDYRVSPSSSIYLATKQLPYWVGVVLIVN